MSNPDDLRQRAERIRDELRTHDPERPVFIEFAGTPKSGKSTCIDIVTHFFRRLEFKVLAPVEGASRRTPYYLKDNWVAFNTWSASYSLMHILEATHGSDQYDLAILDRGLFDALAWFQLLTARGDIDEGTRDRIHNFLLIDEWRSKIDAVLLFTSDADTSLDRESRDKIISDEGRAMNPELLPQLNEAYKTVRETHADEFPRFADIDTSASKQTSPKSTGEEAVALILNVLESKLEES